MPAYATLFNFTEQGLKDIKGTVDRARPEDVHARAAKRMPVGDGEPQVLRHRLPVDDFVRVVMAEGERVVRVRTFMTDRLDAREMGSGGGRLLHCGVSKGSDLRADGRAVSKILHPTIERL